MTSPFPPHLHFPEPVLTFNPDGSSDTEIHPLRGLLRFGPFSQRINTEPIQIATITPASDAQLLYDFITDLKNQHNPKERTVFLPRWPGFKEVFKIGFNAANPKCHEKLDHIDTEIGRVTNPASLLKEHLVQALHRLKIHRAAFDVVFLYLPRRWQAGFHGKQKDDFDLHDHLKAVAASLGIPIQLIREDGARKYNCQASVAWHVGIALYVKAGGIPWKLADFDEDSAFIGISYAIRAAGTDQQQFVTCCSQVFDSGGSGLEFVAYDARDFKLFNRNPFLSRTEMFRVINRSMDFYRKRFPRRNPRRVTVHKTTEFKHEEIQGALEALQSCEEVDLIQVVDDAGWNGVRMNSSSIQGAAETPARYPVHRGTLVGLGPFDALLWTHGNVQDINQYGNYFQGSRGTPRPIKLVRHAGHGSWDHVARTTLGLSKMNWNNDALYNRLPVTMQYAKVLSRVVKRMPGGIGTSPYEIRFFM